MRNGTKDEAKLWRRERLVRALYDQYELEISILFFYHTVTFA